MFTSLHAGIEKPIFVGLYPTPSSVWHSSKTSRLPPSPLCLIFLYCASIYVNLWKGAQEIWRKKPFYSLHTSYPERRTPSHIPLPINPPTTTTTPHTHNHSQNHDHKSLWLASCGGKLWLCMDHPTEEWSWRLILHTSIGQVCLITKINITKKHKIQFALQIFANIHSPKGAYVLEKVGKTSRQLLIFHSLTAFKRFSA